MGLNKLKDKSGKREYAFATFVGLVVLTGCAAGENGAQALETLKIVQVPGMAIIGWGTGLHWYSKQRAS